MVIKIPLFLCLLILLCSSVFAQEVSIEKLAQYWSPIIFHWEFDPVRPF